MTRAEQVRELLLRWDELREQGQSVSPEELCRDCPELVVELRQAIEAIAAMYRVPSGDITTANLGPGDREPKRLPVVAGYELERELGSGGMGVVYKARHARLKRDVAIKMIRTGLHAGPGELARFRTEAEAAARLQHPHIVQIHEIAEHAGLPCLVLEFVDGPSLAECLKDGPLPPRRAAEVAEVLARAVHYAHQRGIVHRDLKPGNVLLGVASPGPAAERIRSDASPAPHRTAPATWFPKIADFGLAKLVDAEISQTLTGAIMGSPGYMAPEQADGRIKDIGPATDVYALGVILYEMLTGQPPFAATTPFEVLEQIRAQEPVAPTRLIKGLPRDLETICLKCLEKTTSRRYHTADSMADDLARYLNGELIAARKFGPLDRVVRTLSRTGTGRFRMLSNLLLLLSPVPLLSNLVVFALIMLESPYAALSIAAMMFAAPLSVGVLFLSSRRGMLTPMTADERQLWSIWFGVLAGLGVLYLVIHRPATAEQPLPDLSLYPSAAVLHGVAFFAMGSTFWGGTYAAGVAFFSLALLMGLEPRWAPLEFGLLLTTTLVAISLRLKRLERR
jgi:serine/threonine protein kinase